MRQVGGADMGEEQPEATGADSAPAAAGLTRRTLIGGLAATGAASVLRPAAGLAGAVSPRHSVSDLWVGDLRGTSALLVAAGPFVLAGLQWAEPAHARLELRAQAPGGRWTPWVKASSTGHDGDGQARNGAQFGEPLWTGSAARVQLRSDRAVRGLRVHFVNVAIPRAGPRSAAAFPQAQPVLDAGAGQPPIIARRAWGAGQARPVIPPRYGTIKLAFVHHTENPNGYSAAAVPALLLAIFAFHVQVRGWDDIGYNFVIDAYGRIWEARAGGIEAAVVGAQAGGYNTESTGVAILGSFMSRLPSPAAITALQQLLAWKLSLHGVPAKGRVTAVVDPADAFYTPFAPGARVSLPRVAGHRDGDSTDCPGDALYGQLPAIRPAAASLQGTPARLTLAAPPEAVRAGATVTLAGELALLSGEPVAGAPIEVQRRPARGGARIFALSTTAGDGSWSTSLTVTRNLLVRALHRPAPASISDWIAVAVAPQLTVTVVSAAPIVVNGSVSPAKRRVRLELYRAGDHRPLASKRLRVVAGRFTGTIAVAGPGQYLVRARTTADASNAAGISPPVPVTVA